MWWSKKDKVAKVLVKSSEMWVFKNVFKKNKYAIWFLYGPKSWKNFFLSSKYTVQLHSWKKKFSGKIVTFYVKMKDL